MKSFFSSKPKLAFFFATGYVLSLIALTTIWYHHYTAFHFFDDRFEWEYLDKLGHFLASFHLGLFLYKTFGNPESLNPLSKKKWICFAGFFLLFPIEILDGFSRNYGASPADLLANGAGSLFCYCHITYRWATGVLPKISFHPTPFCLVRPDLLGASIFEQGIKDYNGQTYWLSVDVNRLVGIRLLPDWLAFAIGYGAEGMLGGHDNVWETEEGILKDYSAIARTKRLFISIDINPSYLSEKNKVLKYLLAPFVWIKFPAPAVEFNFERGIIFHPIYFRFPLTQNPAWQFFSRCSQS